MFFTRLERGNEIVIDGEVYIISMSSNVENFVCRSALFEVASLFTDDRLSMECQPDTYLQWKKELQKACKAWDQSYVKHQKAKIYDEMQDLHNRAMKPLSDLIAKNLEFSQLEKMIDREKEGAVPQFRFIALEEEFVKTMTNVCEIFKLYGDNRVEEHYDIRQQLETLKISKDGIHWKDITPFACYLNPLKEATTTVRLELQDMHKKGPLLIKYYVEDNEDLRNKVLHMLKMDQKAQLLMGDKLR